MVAQLRHPLVHQSLVVRVVSVHASARRRSRAGPRRAGLCHRGRTGESYRILFGRPGTKNESLVISIAENRISNPRRGAVQPGKNSSHAKATSSPRSFSTFSALGHSRGGRSGDVSYPIVFLGELGVNPPGRCSICQRGASDHLDAGLGTVSKICEAAPPHLPCGAPSQAWSVACVLEAWTRLERARRLPDATSVRP